MELDTPPARPWYVIWLATMLAVFVMVEIFVDTDFDHAAMWDVVTAAGFTEWATITIGLLISNSWAVLALALAVFHTVRRADDRWGGVDLGLGVLGFFAVLVIARPLQAAIYLVMAPMIWNWTFRWAQRDGGGRWRAPWLWVFVSLCCLGVAAPLTDGRAWAPVLACAQVDGHASQTRVVTLKRDGTAVVGLRLSDGEVVQASGCVRSTNDFVGPSVLRPWHDSASHWWGILVG